MPAKPARRARTRTRTRNVPSPRAILVMVALLALSAGGLAAYKQHWEATHDLSVIGSGVHAVVQVHDPACSLCRTLKANTERALAGLDAPIEYRIADIHTPEGRALQHRHQVPHVTLLLFEPDGTLWRALSGVKSAETLQHVLRAFAGAGSGREATS